MLFRSKNGSILKQVDGSVYSTIDDYFAKRTYDTNGDYIVSPFKFTPAVNSDSTKFNIGISKGIAYVKGYRVENQSTVDLVNDRARTFDSFQQNNVSVDYGNFFYVNTLKGTTGNFFDIGIMQSVDFHSVPTSNVVSTNASTYNSTLVATGKIRNFDYDHYTGTSANTASYVYKAYVFDIETKTLSSSVSTATTNTVQFSDPNGIFSTKNDAYVGAILTIDSGTSIGDKRKITAYNGSTKTATVDQVFSITPTSSSVFSIRFGIKDIETIVSVNSSYSILASANIDVSSKSNSISTGDTILNDTGYSELIFQIGNPYRSEEHTSELQSH